MSDNSQQVTKQQSRRFSRRGFLGQVGAVSAIGVAASAIPGHAAAAALSGARIKTFEGRYAIDSHRIVDGLIASPRKGASKLDVIVVVPKDSASARAAEAAARNYAAAGWLAIAPNLSKTYAAAASSGQAAMVAALMRDLPRFKKLARGSGKVTFVHA